MGLPVGRMDTRGQWGSSFGRYWAVVRASALSHFAYVVDSTGMIVAQIAVLWLQIAVWRSLLADGRQCEGIGLSYMVTYLILGMFQRTMDSPYIEARFVGYTKTGQVCFDMLRPCNLHLYVLSEHIGGSVARLATVALPCVVVGWLFFGFRLPDSPVRFGVFLLSGLLAFLILFEMSLVCGILSLWSTEGRIFGFLRRRVTEVLSGSLIPLSLFPAPARAVALALPFHTVAYLPISIYTGSTSLSLAWRALLTQAGWLVCLSAVSVALWSMARARVAVGGG